MRDRRLREVRIDGFDDLVVVRTYTLKLIVEVVEPRDKLPLRRVAAYDFEALREDAFDDEPAAVMLQSCLTKHLLKADVLLLVEAKRILVASLLLSHVVFFFFRIPERPRLGSGPASQSKRFCRTNANLSDKNTACSHLAMG